MKVRRTTRAGWLSKPTFTQDERDIILGAIPFKDPASADGLIATVENAVGMYLSNLAGAAPPDAKKLRAQIADRIASIDGPGTQMIGALEALYRGDNGESDAMIRYRLKHYRAGPSKIIDLARATSNFHGVAEMVRREMEAGDWGTRPIHEDAHRLTANLAAAFEGHTGNRAGSGQSGPFQRFLEAVASSFGRLRKETSVPSHRPHYSISSELEWLRKERAAAKGQDSPA